MILFALLLPKLHQRAAKNVLKHLVDPIVKIVVRYM